MAATAAEEVSRKETMAAGRETPNGKETENAMCAEENGCTDRAGLDAAGFILVCHQLMRDNFLVKVGTKLCGIPTLILTTYTAHMLHFFLSSPF